MQHLATSCLDRLTERDFRFIEEALTGKTDPGDSLRWLFEDANTLPTVLESDSVFRRVVEVPFPVDISPQFYFYVLVRRALKDAGIDKIEIADYVAAALADNACGHSAAPVGLEKPDHEFTYHIDFLAACEAASAYDRFFLEVECGNRFLVLTGLFPAFLEHRANRRGAPSLDYYEEVARNAFVAAGSRPLADEFAVRTIYPMLAECFSETRRALNRMSEEMLFLSR